MLNVFLLSERCYYIFPIFFFTFANPGFFPVTYGNLHKFSLIFHANNNELSTFLVCVSRTIEYFKVKISFSFRIWFHIGEIIYSIQSKKAFVSTIFF